MELENIDPETVPNARVASLKVNMVCVYYVFLEYTYIVAGSLLKFSKSRKQITKFSHTPKNQRNFVHFFDLAYKKWLKQKIKALDDLN